KTDRPARLRSCRVRMLAGSPANYERGVSMAPERWLARVAHALVPVAICAPRAHALRLVDYNITNYPSVLFPQRQPYFRTVMAPLGADAVTPQEKQSQAR